MSLPTVEERIGDSGNPTIVYLHTDGDTLSWIDRENFSADRMPKRERRIAIALLEVALENLRGEAE